VVNRVSSLSFAAFGAGTHCAVHAYVVVVVSAAATKADDNDNEKKKKKKKEKKDAIVDEERVTSPNWGQKRRKSSHFSDFFGRERSLGFRVYQNPKQFNFSFFFTALVRLIDDDDDEETRAQKRLFV